ncbi:MAG: DUF11 domain-containing protein [Myxococcales bacterium]|nr:DUF11 domain-containing protein [Myxococcales bacterium]
MGDVLTFILQFTAVSNNSIRGLNGYITEYIPPNTEVVGLRIVDKDGNTIEPRRAGMAPDGWGLKATNYSAFSLSEGSMAGVFADTGIFYSSSALTARVPSNALPTVSNGVQLLPAPSRANEFDELLGIPGGPYYIHNNWDWVQTMAYGTQGALGAPPGGDINKFGKGNTPFLYGSAVAGPSSYYQYEATQTSPGTIVPNGTTGPWVRVAYPGSEIGSGAAATSAGSFARVGTPTSAGYNLSTANPLPSTANAVRFALGQLRVGQQYFVEVSLRVTGSPLDPGVGLDANCGEVFGGAGTSDKPDNTWAYALPSVNCVLLNLQFEKSVDKVLATSGDTVTYKIKGKNLSTNTRTNVVVTDTYIASDLTLVSATGSPTVSGGVITWPTIGSWPPGAEFEHTVVMTISGQGQGSTFNTARIVYDQLPAGFTTQAVVNRIQVALLDFDMVAVPNQVAAGGTFAYQVTIKNDGTGTAANSGCNNTAGCLYGVTLPAGFSVVPGSSQINGTPVSNPTASGQRYIWTSGVLAIASGATVTLTFNVQASSTPGLYTACAEAWLNSNGPFNDTECKLGPIAVGASRSAAPVITAPVVDTDTCISGTTSEANGTTITLYINGIARGTTTSSGGAWQICGFPPLYGGQIVTATATAPGKLVSLPSSPVTVLTLPKCSDGIDNDNDGLIDFPADPGCSSPTDSTEDDPPTPECSDGVDNDNDGLIDAQDPGCSSPFDTSEGGAPECSDGIDNDGDGRVDFPNDTGCTSANDATEVSESLAACNDGIDNDGDGRIDFKADGTGDPGCHSANDNNEVDDPPSGGEIKPRLLIVFDTSGSMNWNTCNNTFTGGDGTQSCQGADVSCATCNGSGCGNGVADDSRIDKVKRGITSVVGSYGSVEYALMRFHQRAMPFACPTDNASLQSGGWQGAGASPCSGGFSAGDLLVGFSGNNAADLLQYIDGSSNYSGTPPPGLDLELRGTGTTPLAGSLTSAHQYIQRVRTSDPQGPCRPYRVILVTDGLETCGGNPANVAATLRADNIRVSVIGFATSDTNIVTQLNSIAASGGTTQALLVDNETTLALEVSKVISESLLSERCNNADDDCDGLCDENFPEVGVTNPACINQRAPQTCTVGLGICQRTASYVCKADGSGSECNVTPGPPNPGGEICGNGLDDDCDGQVDEGCTPCVPQAEVCNGRDDNCNGQIDEGYVSVPCGSNVGECTQGTTACVNGQVVCNGATGPGTEVCDNRDNNCDTIVDLFSRSCYPAASGCNVTTGVCQGVCQVGTQTCIAGAWGQCLNFVGPTPEVCNGLDDNCDGQVDEGVLNTCTNYATCQTYTTCSQCPARPAEICDGIDNDCDGQVDNNALQVGDACGVAIGECRRGTFACVSGALVCQGQTGPTNETCDNRDNDCDGTVDNNIPGLGQPCGSSTGICRPGTNACVGGQTVCLGAVQPQTEVCDGLDNNCDGQVDNGIPSVPCGSNVGACRAGSTACVNGQTVCQGAIGPSAEVCDGIDNDCNGLVDDNPTDVGTACGSAVGECKQGVTQCVAGQRVCTGGVGPQPEICDGKDNDCDGQVDNGIANVGNTCGSDVGECKKGTLACVNVPGSGYALVCQGSVGPAPEVCDGKDNNCDGQTDETYPEQGQTCSKNVGECKGGNYACEAGKLLCKGGTTPQPEICDGLDNDCNGAIDDNVPGEGQPCGQTTTGQCKAGATKCVGGKMICIGQIGPQKEICNGKDDDCDGQADNNAECPGQSSCLEGQCVVPCGSGEFACPGGTKCKDGYCVPDACFSVTCDNTARCIDGKCVSKCDGSNCDAHEKCEPTSGRCVDDSCLSKGCPDKTNVCVAYKCQENPCPPDKCGPNQQCSEGKCYESCLNVKCEAGKACVQGKCSDDPCDGVKCEENFRCVVKNGATSCEPDPCRAVNCPPGQTCRDGICGDDPCATTHCPDYLRCVLSPSGKATCEPIPGAVLPSTKSLFATGAGGCRCSTGGEIHADGALLALLLLGLLGIDRRRRRRRRCLPRGDA